MGSLGYSNITLIQNLISQAIVYGSPESTTQPADLVNVGNSFDNNKVPDTVIEQFITFADQQINAAINELYITPLCQKANFETTLLTNIDDSSMDNTVIVTKDQCPFYIGDNIVLTNGYVDEKCVISAITNANQMNAFTLTEPLTNSFLASETRVIRIGYPEPISLTSARIAAANIYEKYFMSQSSPNESEYGKFLRKMARADIDNILNGRTILHGAVRIGNKFFNSNISGRYALPKIDITENNVDDIG